MSYTPTEWKNGDIVTAEKLNKLENGVSGIGSGVLSVGVEYINQGASDIFTLQATAKEIMDAMDAMIPVFAFFTDNGISMGCFLLYAYYTYDGEYCFQADHSASDVLRLSGGGLVEFVSDGEDKNPSYIFSQPK